MHIIIVGGGLLFEVGCLKSTFPRWGGGGGCLFEAGHLLPSGWALIQGWALNRINTVLHVPPTK